MKKNYKKNYEKNYEKMDLMEDLKMPLLNFSFVMIYIIHKMLVLLKNHLKFLKVVFSNCFLKENNSLLMFFLKNYIFS